MEKTTKKEIWTVYPKDEISLDTAHDIKYGQLPAWANPESSSKTAPTLSNGVYVAVAYRYDGVPKSIEFEMRDGRAISRAPQESK